MQGPIEHRPAVAVAPSSADAPPLVDPGTGDARGGPASLARGGGLVGLALALVNVVGYAFAVVASRALTPAQYGEVTALLGVLLVASVPALAAQAVVARAVARAEPGRPAGVLERGLLLRSALTGAAVSGAVALLAPAVAAFLHTSVAGPLWVAASLAPLAVLSGAQGLLQGAERFGALALLMVAQALSKAVAVVPLLLDRGPSDVLAALALGTAGAAACGLLLTGAGHGGLRSGLPPPREVALAAGGLLALLALANLDLLLARNVLPADRSGTYAVGSVMAKAAFWLPQAVAVVAFPRLSDPVEGEGVLRRAAGLVAGLGLLEVVGCLLLARPVLEVTFGRQYGDLAGLAPVFVLQGGALAVVQLVVYRGIATASGTAGRLVVGALVLEAVVVTALQPRTSGPVVVAAAATAVALAAGGLLLRPAGRGVRA